MISKGEIEPVAVPGEGLSDLQLQMKVAHLFHLSKALPLVVEKNEALADYTVFKAELDARDIPEREPSKLRGLPPERPRRRARAS